MTMEKLATRCARYKAERDLARQELDRLKDRSRDTTMSAYDLLPKEERDAIAWVRGHGGLEDAMDMWSERARLWSELTRVALACGADGSGGEGTPEEVGSAIASALERRLMPRGMEWPRFEDGEPVRIGDTAQFDSDDVMEVVGVEINRFGYVLHGSINDGMRKCVEGDEHGVAVKRPAPKVLDADGAEVEVGDDLYSIEGILKFHVSAIDRKSGRIATEAMLALDKWADPKMYTHRAPVLAADGRPLRVGETVWEVETGDGYIVERIYSGTTEPYFPGHTVACLRPDDVATHMFKPSQLTHERPESWERLEEDARQLDIDLNDTTDDYPRMSCCRDLVRRAKALAGVSE